VFSVAPFSATPFSSLPAGSANVLVAVTGVEATSQLGSVTVFTGISVPVTGVEATSQLGSVTVQATAYVYLTGLESTSELGSVAVQAKGNAAVTGVEGTATLGTVSITGAAVVTLTGLEGTSQLGSVTAQANADVDVTGLESTAALGTVSVTGTAVVTLTGLVGTTALGSATVEADAIVQVTGVSATAENGSVTVVGKATVTLTGLGATAYLGTADVIADAIVPVTGVSASTSVGSVSVIAKAVVSLTGVSATAYVNDVIVWGEIQTNDGSLNQELLQWVDTKAFNDYFISEVNEDLQDSSVEWHAFNRPTSGTYRTVQVGYGTGKTTRLTTWSAFDNNAYFYGAPYFQGGAAYGNQRQYLSFRIPSASSVTGRSNNYFRRIFSTYFLEGYYVSHGMGYGVELHLLPDSELYPLGNEYNMGGVYVVPMLNGTYERFGLNPQYSLQFVSYSFQVLLKKAGPYPATQLANISLGASSSSIIGDWRIRTYDRPEGDIGWSLDKLERETFAQGGRYDWVSKKNGFYSSANLPSNPETTRTYGGLILPKTPYLESGIYAPFVNDAVTSPFTDIHWGLSSPWSGYEVNTGSQTSSTWLEVLT